MQTKVTQKQYMDSDNEENDCFSSSLTFCGSSETDDFVRLYKHVGDALSVALRAERSFTIQHSQKELTSQLRVVCVLNEDEREERRRHSSESSWWERKNKSRIWRDTKVNNSNLTKGET